MADRLLTPSEAGARIRARGLPSTPDDVTILRDGRRLRTEADVRAFLEEFAAASVE